MEKIIRFFKKIFTRTKKADGVESIGIPGFSVYSNITPAGYSFSPDFKHFESTFKAFVKEYIASANPDEYNTSALDPTIQAKIMTEFKHAELQHSRNMAILKQKDIGVKRDIHNITAAEEACTAQLEDMYQQREELQRIYNENKRSLKQ